MIPVEFVNSVAQHWVANTVTSLWQSTVVTLFLLAAVRLGWRWPAPLRYGLLLVALLKFLVPPALCAPGLLGWLPQQHPIDANHASAAPAPAPALPPPLLLAEANDAAPITPGVGRVAQRTTLSWRAWMMGAQVLGLLAVLVWIFWQAARLRQLSSRSTTVTDGMLYDTLNDLCDRVGLRRRPRLLLTDHATAPAAYGVLTPTVVLPRYLVSALTPADLRIVLAHELAHHRRGDLCVKWLQVGLSAVWWFDPVYWLLSRQLRSAAEDCCDDLVLGRGLTSGEAYSGTLLRAARLACVHVRDGAALACAFGARPLRRRVSRVMRAGFRPAPACSAWQKMVVLGIGLVLLPGGATRAARSGETRTTTRFAEQFVMTESRHESTSMSTQVRSSGESANSPAVERARRELRSGDPTQRATAAMQLGNHGVTDAIPQLVLLLADEAPIPRAPAWGGSRDWSPALTTWLHPSPGEAAAIALASMSQKAAPALMEALGHSRAAARRNAAWALGELHAPRLPGLPEVAPLVQALRDSDGGVRAAAAWALGETKDRRATEPLISALHDDRDPDVRRQSAHALGELADPSAADALLDALEDPDARVRDASHWALGEIMDRIGDVSRRRGY